MKCRARERNIGQRDGGRQEKSSGRAGKMSTRQDGEEHRKGRGGKGTGLSC